MLVFNMRIQGLVIFISLFHVRSQHIEYIDNDVEILDSGIIQGPVAAALVDAENADIGNGST